MRVVLDAQAVRRVRLLVQDPRARLASGRRRTTSSGCAACGEPNVRRRRRVRGGAGGRPRRAPAPAGPSSRAAGRSARPRRRSRSRVPPRWRPATASSVLCMRRRSGASTVVTTVTTISAASTLMPSPTSMPTIAPTPANVSIPSVNAEIWLSLRTAGESAGRSAPSMSDACEVHSAARPVTPKARHSQSTSSIQSPPMSVTSAAIDAAIVASPSARRRSSERVRRPAPAAAVQVKTLKPRLVPTTRQWISSNEPLSSAITATAPDTHRPPTSALLTRLRRSIGGQCSAGHDRVLPCHPGALEQPRPGRDLGAARPARAA